MNQNKKTKKELLMNRDELRKVADELQEAIGTEEFLNELLTALTSDHLYEYLEHIDNMFDVGLIE